MARYPQLFIVGAAKAGTSALHHYLAQHPELGMSAFKEPHHFASFTPDPRLRHMIRRYEDPAQYLALFAAHAQRRIWGESSPSYLFDEQAARRIHARVPQARLIVLLRDPVARAYSHYLMDCREGLQREAFWPALLRDYALPGKTWGGAGHCYVELGFYARQLRRYLDLFARDQLLILEFAELCAQPASTLRRVAAFLDIDPQGFAAVQAEAVNAYARPRHALGRRLMAQQGLRRAAQALLPPGARRFIRERLLLRRSAKPAIEPQALHWLRALYAPELQALEALLGQALPSLRLELPEHPDALPDLSPQPA